MFTKVFAQSLTFPGNGQPVTISGPTGFKFTTLGGVVGSLIPYFILFAGIGMLLMLIFGGIGLMSGGSDPKQLDNARKQITFGIVGFLIVFLAYWGVQLIGIMFGITEFTNIFR